MHVIQNSKFKLSIYFYIDKMKIIIKKSNKRDYYYRFQVEI